MLKIQVVGVLVALVHCSLAVLVQLDSTDFNSSPCGWTLQNFAQYGSNEAEEYYNIQKTDEEKKYLVLTESQGKINREYQLKQSAEIEVRFKYYQTGGKLQLLYLEADNSVPVHLAYSHDGEEGSEGWKSGEAHISRSATEQPFTILFEATTKDPKVDPVALDSVTVLFEDAEVNKRSLSEDLENSLKKSLEYDTVKTLENYYHQNSKSNNKERRQEHQDPSLDEIARKTIKKEDINKKRQSTDADTSDESIEDSETNEDVSKTDDNQNEEPVTSDETTEADGSESEESQTNDPSSDFEDSDAKTPETEVDTPEDESNPTDAPDTSKENPESESEPTNAPETDGGAPESEDESTNAPETNDETSETESHTTKVPDTNNGDVTVPAASPTEAPSPQENPTNATKSPEGVTATPPDNQQSSENENSTKTDKPPSATAPPSVKNTTLNPEPKTTNQKSSENTTKAVTAEPVPSIDKTTTQAPKTTAEPTPIPPILTTAPTTAKPETTTSKEENTDGQDGSKDEIGNIHMWYIPVTIVILVVLGVIFFRYMQLKRRRTGYSRTGSVGGGDYNNPTFTGDTGDSGPIYGREGRSYDSIR